MKTLTERSERIMAIKQLLSRSGEAFEDLEAGQELRKRFLQKSEVLDQRLKQLVVPFRATYIERVESRTAYLELLQPIISMGMMIASRTTDSALMVTFKSYNHRIKEASAARLIAIGQAVEQFVAQNSDTLLALGVIKQKQQQLSNLKKLFQQAIKQATNAADDRRNLNREIRQLIKECNHIMRWELDIYLRFNSAHFPALYAHYHYLRNPRRRQKPNKAETTEHCDLPTKIAQVVESSDKYAANLLKAKIPQIYPTITSRKDESYATKWFLSQNKARPDLFPRLNLN